MRVKAYIWIAFAMSLTSDAWGRDNSVEVTLEDSPVVREEQDAELARLKKDFEAKMKDFQAKINAAVARGEAGAKRYQSRSLSYSRLR